MPLSPGTRLGPYEILEPLGAGGMGEVYRARDPRLGRDVAVKVVRTDGSRSPDRLRRFETEARAAGRLSHPNVVTVHDVGVCGGQPYLVLELLEGETLRGALRAGVPTLREAVTWGLAAARGLAAAHERGILHRDLKPENVFLTLDGRVKVLDFGLAKLRETHVSPPDRESPTESAESRPGMLVGTAGYMSPEQVRGESPDARSDVFSFGAVLYEIVTGRRAFEGSSTSEVLASILRDEPPAVGSLEPEVPASLEATVHRCLAKRPAERFSSAGEVAAALEAVLASLGAGRFATARPPEVRGPYPGLESFRESDTERFFGREAEVEALWAKLPERRLLAVIGPSGVGKTSFMRAGVLASRPTGWAALACAPGANPFRSLGQALAPQLADDPEALRQLVSFDDLETAVGLMERWRRAHSEALVVVDQMEELFTLSPEEEQARFAELIGRVSTEADVHVVLSMRDDFLMRCSEHDALAKVFTELTPLRPLSGDALRRALEEPAKREGYSFEEGLVEEMLQAVEGARGALPLLAFAALRLWQKRDREKKLLTRAAYEEIGGVAGALAQHAEATLERIGDARQGLVREIFRNLVTAQGTRASCEREELLSAFPERASAETALEELIDARLLTSYEATDSAGGRPGGQGSAPSSRGAPSGAGDEGSAAGPRTVHRIEIVHESLLKAWPRLVWWQAQDEEGAQLRDQLRQAARLWEEKGRTEDLLWSGTAEREFEVWRERYPGQLTAVEDDFARAMVDRARRRRRMVRGAVVAFVVTLSAVAAAIAVSRQNEAEARRRAEAEALQREAGELLALGRLELEDRPTAGLAYALASLERADTPAARRFAVETLSRGAAAFVLDSPANLVSFSRDGRWLTTSGIGSEGTRLWSRDGDPAVSLGEWAGVGGAEFDPEGPFLKVSGFPRLADGSVPSMDDLTIHVYSVPDPEPILTVDGWSVSWLTADGRGLSAWALRRSQLFTFEDDEDGTTVRAQRVGEDEARVVGRWDRLNATSWWVDVSGDGRWLTYARDREVFLHPVEGHGVSERRVGEHPGKVLMVAFGPGGDHIVSTDALGEIRVWSVDGGVSRLERAVRGGSMMPFASLDPAGSTLAFGKNAWHPTPEMAKVLDLDGPPDAEPLTLRNGDARRMIKLEVSPDGRWLATANEERAILWALGGRRGRALGGHTPLGQVAFTPDGRWLASAGRWCGVEGSACASVGLYPLSPAVAPGRRVILEQDGKEHYAVAIDPAGRNLLTHSGGEAVLVPLDGGAPRKLPRLSSASNLGDPALSPDGRLAAIGAFFGEEGNLVEVWDLQSGEGRTLDPRSEGEECGNDVTSFSAVKSLQFTSQGRLLTAGLSGLRLWNLEDDTNVLLRPCAKGVAGPRLAGSLEDRFLLAEPDETQRTSVLTFHDLRASVTRELTSHGNGVRSVALDLKGEIAVTGSFDGLVRVGGVNDEEPHLLYGHEGDVLQVAVSPDRRWIASQGADGTVRLWPMAQGRPFHALPYEELLSRIRSYTNLRVVADEGSPTGYGVEVGPFPGWAVVPEW